MDTSFVARILANVRNFERNIKRAQASAQSLPNEIETDVDANISKFRRGLLKAEALAKAFSANNIKKNIMGDAKNFRQAMFGAKESVIDFDKHYQDAAGRWREIGTGRYVKEFEKIDSVFTRLKKKMRDPFNIRAEVDVDGTSIRRAYHSIKKNFTDPFNRRMGELAENIRSIGTVVTNQIKGAFVSSFSAIVPIVAGATSAVMALGNAIGVTAGGLIGAAGAFGIFGAGAVTYGGLVASVLNRYNDEAFEATAASNRFTKALDTIKGSWSGIVDQHMDTIFQTMGQAIYGANHALQAMSPFIDGVVASVAQLTNRFKDFMTESIIMEDFFNNMNTTGVKIFDNIANAAMSFTEGLFDSMNGLMPLFDWAAQGINGLAEQFSGWAQTMAGSNGFTKFIEYTQTNLPKVGQIFGNTFLGIIDLFAAFGANSSNVFDGLVEMTTRFREWASTISESTAFQDFIGYIERTGPAVVSLIGNIVMAIVNFGIALAPLGEAVLNVVNNVINFVQELLRTNPIVGQIIGIIATLAGVFMLVVPALIQVFTFLQPLITKFGSLRAEVGIFKAIWATLTGAFSWILSPITLIVAAIVGLVASFMHLWQTNEGFRTRVMEIWSQIKEHISNAITAVSTFVMSIWGTLVSWWNENNALILATVTDIWMNGILPLIQSAMNLLVPIVKVAWAVIKTVIKVALDLILSIIRIGLQLFNSDWSGAWQTALDFLSRIWSGIKTAINSAIAFLLPYIIRFASQAYQWIREKFEQAKIILETIWSVIKARIQARLQQILTNLVLKFQEMKQNIQDKMEQAKQLLVVIWNTIKLRVQQKILEISNNIRRKFQEIKQTIQDKIQEAKTALVNKMQEMATNARNKAQEVYTNIKEKISEVPGMVGDFISDAAQAVVDKASEFVSAGGDIIAGLKEGIVGAAQGAIDAVTGVVEDALGAAKSLLGIKSPSRAFMELGKYTSQGLAIGINRDADRAVREVTRMSNDMTKAYAPELTGINAGMDAELNNMNKDIRNTVDADITSGVKTQRPIVNVTVRNEGDLEAIRSAIDTEDGIDEQLAF